MFVAIKKNHIGCSSVLLPIICVQVFQYIKNDSETLESIYIYIYIKFMLELYVQDLLFERKCFLIPIRM